ncbi:MAG: DUF4197 domain-containing protein [Saprospiraceae bacterium]|jgi:hypothetical protein|nr:DUF4197 domain-containing protein [Saprospiraceae bacterium]
MLRTFSFLLMLALLSSCTASELQRLLGGELPLTEAEAASGLKEALSLGIGKGSELLALKDGYYKSEYKILLPAEARKITEKLKVIPGFNNVEEIILERINRGAEDAAMKAKPIFLNAIKEMSFMDAMNILMGNQDAATRYLETATNEQLYQQFNPVIVESLDRLNARKYWADAVAAYNKIPFVDRANPDLDDYVTREALKGMFGMVAKEELNIRTNLGARTSELLKKVFAKQDKK